MLVTPSSASTTAASEMRDATSLLRNNLSNPKMDEVEYSTKMKLKERLKFRSGKSSEIDTIDSDDVTPTTAGPVSMKLTDVVNSELYISNDTNVPASTPSMHSDAFSTSAGKSGDITDIMKDFNLGRMSELQALPLEDTHIENQEIKNNSHSFLSDDMTLTSIGSCDELESKEEVEAKVILLGLGSTTEVVVGGNQSNATSSLAAIASCHPEEELFTNKKAMSTLSPTESMGELTKASLEEPKSLN